MIKQVEQNESVLVCCPPSVDPLGLSEDQFIFENDATCPEQLTKAAALIYSPGGVTSHSSSYWSHCLLITACCDHIEVSLDQQWVFLQ